MITYDYKTRVYYKDIDQMGIVYYNRYLEYFEAARTELLRSVGLDVTEIETSGYYLPVITSHCDYLEGARFDDELLVQTSIKTLPKLRMRIDYRILKKDSENPLVTGYTVHVFTSREGNPVRPPKMFIDKLTKAFDH